VVANEGARQSSQAAAGEKEGEKRGGKGRRMIVLIVL